MGPRRCRPRPKGARLPPPSPRPPGCASDGDHNRVKRRHTALVRRTKYTAPAQRTQPRTKHEALSTRTRNQERGTRNGGYCVQRGAATATPCITSALYSASSCSQRDFLLFCHSFLAAQNGHRRERNRRATVVLGGQDVENLAVRRRPVRHRAVQRESFEEVDLRRLADDLDRERELAAGHPRAVASAAASAWASSRLMRDSETPIFVASTTGGASSFFVAGPCSACARAIAGPARRPTSRKTTPRRIRDRRTGASKRRDAARTRPTTAPTAAWRPRTSSPWSRADPTRSRPWRS